jgi:hypothetical protein
MRELEFVSSDYIATDDEWEAFEKRDDLFSFYSPDCHMIYVLKEKEKSSTGSVRGAIDNDKD